MKAIGDVVKLRKLFWLKTLPDPRPGDGLRTRTGRLYVIRRVRGRELECVVAPPDAVVPGLTFDWRWSSRRRRAG